MPIAKLIREIVDTTKTGFREAPDGLRPPASEAKLSVLREALDGELSDELADLLRTHDGEDYTATTFLLGGKSWLLPADEIAAERTQLRRLATASGRLDVLAPEQTHTVGPVKPCHWNSRWIPFYRADSVWAVDMDPDEGGNRGQVINVVWDDLEVRVEFGCLEEMLAQYLATLKRGDRRFVAALGS